MNDIEKLLLVRIGMVLQAQGMHVQSIEYAPLMQLCECGGCVYARCSSVNPFDLRIDIEVARLNIRRMAMRDGDTTTEMLFCHDPRENVLILDEKLGHRRE